MVAALGSSHRCSSCAEAHRTLAGRPPKQLSQAERAAKRKASRCRFIHTRVPRLGRQYKLFDALLLIGLGVSIALHWNERLYFHLTHQWNVSAHDPALRWLPGYRSTTPDRSGGISRNLSAITYDSDLDRLLGVINGGPTEIVALSKRGELLERHTAGGFGDIEG